MFNFGMIEWMLIGILAIAVIVIVYRMRRSASSPEWIEQAQRQPPEIDWNAASDPEIGDYLSRGKKIDAIKRYRELTGAGLKEAKDALDYLAAHPQAAGDKKKAPLLNLQGEGVRDLVEAGKIDEAVEVYAKFAGVDIYSAKDAVAEIQREPEASDHLSDAASAADPQIVALVQQGKKIEAIKIYRERTGLGLKEAKDAVEQIEREMKG
jgi:ribosomal protein L7/L12